MKLKTNQAKVAIIGRANVGKSTLFNRLTRDASRTIPPALTSPRAGTTRDRNETECLWRGRQFTIVDTGGLDINPRETMSAKVAAQARRAINEADLILFLVDVKTGAMPADFEIARFMRSINKNILLVANKADNRKLMANAVEFYRLGHGAPHTVSAASGIGTGDLLDTIVQKLRPQLYKETEALSVAILGKPNVGKSSLVNALVGEERAIVDEEPYTTRDAHAVYHRVDGQLLQFVDTAGVRKKSSVQKKNLEAESVTHALRLIKNADIILLVTEVHVRLTAQDKQLARLAGQSNASLVIVANKWDLLEAENQRRVSELTRYYRAELNFISWAPIIFLSAKHATKVPALIKRVITVNEERSRRVSDEALVKFLASAMKRQRPTIGKGTRKPFIRYMKQVGINPPQFVLSIDAKSSLNYSYLHYLERQLRDTFGFDGSPIKMWVEKKR